jgi:hypothetical protein
MHGIFFPTFERQEKRKHLSLYQSMINPFGKSLEEKETISLRKTI